MSEDIAGDLWEFLRENCLPRHGRFDYDDGTNLFEKGVIDSAGVLAFVGFIEETYGLSIPDEDLLPENFISVAAAASYVRRRLPGRPHEAAPEP